MVRDSATEGLATTGAAPSGSGYRAIITSGLRIIWSCPHVHFTEHSSKACAELHLACVADKTFMGAALDTGGVAGPNSKVEVAPSGSGYRAIVSSDGRVPWSCSHVHFTGHSAQTCAEQHVGKGPPAGELSGAV